MRKASRHMLLVVRHAEREARRGRLNKQVDMEVVKGTGGGVGGVEESVVWTLSRLAVGADLLGGMGGGYRNREHIRVLMTAVRKENGPVATVGAGNYAKSRKNGATAMLEIVGS